MLVGNSTDFIETLVKLLVRRTMLLLIARTFRFFIEILRFFKDSQQTLVSMTNYHSIQNIHCLEVVGNIICYPEIWK